MIDLLIQLFINACFILGLWFAFNQEGAVFENVGTWIEMRLPEFISKPLLTCPVCMSTVWGLPIAIVTQSGFIIPIYWVALAGLIHIITK
jgi:hypothetical protein